MNFLLDLFEAGYEKSYLSVIDFYQWRNNIYYRIEMFLPNVGRMYLYQSFDEELDEQRPHIDIFYSGPLNNNTETQIKNIALLNRAVKIIYKTKRYFEQHPEHKIQNKELLSIIKSNEKILQEQHVNYTKKRQGILRCFFEYGK